MEHDVYSHEDRNGACRKGSCVCSLYAAFLFFFSVFQAWQRPIHAQTAEVSQIKGAYLYNFAKYVEWPSNTFRNEDDPAVICVVGDDRTAEALPRIIFGKKANGRRIEARTPRSANEFRVCHILFIGFSDKDRITGILRTLQESNVLVVGQTDQFLSLGGMINLVQKNGSIELEIDLTAADAADLKISSRLLVISRVIRDVRSQGER